MCLLFDHLVTAAHGHLLMVLIAPCSHDMVFYVNLAAGKLVTCVGSEMCPYSQYLRNPLTQEMSFINKAPHFGFGGYTAVVNKLQNETYKQAVYSFFSFISQSKAVSVEFDL